MRKIIVYCLFLTLAFGSSIESLEDLKRFIKTGEQKGYFPRSLLGYRGMKKIKLRKIELKDANVMEWNENSKCIQYKNNIILAQDNANHFIKCRSKDTVFIGGDGNNSVEVPWGIGIYVTSKGNDIFKVGKNGNVFIFEKHWGHDEISFVPMEVDVSKAQSYDGSYPYIYNTFFIFKEGIKREDLAWDGIRLVNTKTNDSIKVKSKKINLLFVDDDNPKPEDENFIPEVLKSNIYHLSSIKDKMVEHRGILYIYKVRGGKIELAKLKDDKIEKFATEDFAHSLWYVYKHKDRLYVIKHIDKKSSVLVINIANPKKPITLARMDFDQLVKGLDVSDGKMFAISTGGQDKQDELSIHDIDYIQTPLNPKPISKTKFKNKATYVKVLGDTVILANFKTISAYDVSDAQKPRLINSKINDKNGVVNMHRVDGRIFFALYDDGSVAKYAVDGWDIKSICEFRLSEKKGSFSRNLDATVSYKDLLFVATKKEGVKVVNIHKCKLVGNIVTDKEVKSLEIIDKRLRIFPDKFVDLEEYERGLR